MTVIFVEESMNACVKTHFQVVVEYTTEEEAQKASEAPCIHWQTNKEKPVVRKISDDEFALMVGGEVPWLEGGPCETELRKALEIKLFGQAVTVQIQLDHDRDVELARRGRLEKTAGAMRQLNSQQGGGKGGTLQYTIDLLLYSEHQHEHFLLFLCLGRLGCSWDQFQAPSRVFWLRENGVHICGKTN